MVCGHKFASIQSLFRRIMERRNFLSTILVAGITMLNSPASTLEIVPEGGSQPVPFYIPPTAPLAPGPGNIDVRTIIRAK